MKMKFLGLLIILGTLAAGSAKAQEEDFFYNHVIVPSGKYKGQAYDTRERRSIRILNETEHEKIYGYVEGTYLIANFFHNKEFYIARIPKIAVKEVLFQSEPFGGFFAHSLTRFSFDERTPIQLIAKVPSLTFSPVPLEKPILLNDMIVSAEAMAPHGVEPFQVVAGFLGHVGIVVRVMSITGRGVSRFTIGNNPSRLYPIDYEHRERQTALTHALELSNEIGMKRMYNTIYCNCNILSMRILKSARYWHDGTRSSVQNMMNWFILIADKFMIVSKIYPPLAVFGLYWRRFLADGSVRNLIDDPAFIKLAETYPSSQPDACAPVITNN